MKYLFFRSFIVLLFLSLIPIVHSCKKHEVPTLATSAVTNITGTTATSGGTISDEGSGTVVERGICWSKGITPTIADNITLEGGGVGTFTSSMTNLDAATTYYVRAYAKNEAGIGYGMAVSFTTLGQAPSAITQAACCLSTTGAKLNGNVNANYVSTTVTFEYGLTTAYGSSVAAEPSPVTGNSSTSVSAVISGLNSNTIYHFRIKAVNSLGTTYGDDMLFTTPIPPPPTNGLVAYYPFNGNANDESGNGKNGTVINAIPIVDRFGNNNKAYGFDGKNGTERYIYSNIGKYNTITFCVWFKSPYPTTYYPNILNYGTSSALFIEINGNNPSYISAGSVGRIHTGSIINDGPNMLAHLWSDNSFADNNWHFVVASLVQNDRLLLYLDNQLIKTEPYTINNPIDDLLYIGRFINDNAANVLHETHFNGSIDDIRIYNRALTADEISSLYHEIP